MQISDLEQETQDFDWFAVDKEGAIAHFTTGGCGALPQSIVLSVEDLRKVVEFFWNRCIPVTAFVVSQAVDLHVSLKDEGEKARYLEDYIKMASRGLFSYDYLRTGKRPAGYFQVAKPSTPLRLSTLPGDIRQILEKTVVEGVFFRAAEEIGLDILR